MSEPMPLKRQWIPMQGGSCDVRRGPDALEQASKVFKAAVGLPRRCVLLALADADAHVCETLQHEASDAGFEPRWCVLGGFERDDSEAHVATLDRYREVAEAFARNGLTSDDLCVAIGDADLLSLASAVCGAWCSGMPLVAVPDSATALLEGALLPRPLDVAALKGAIAVRPAARHVLLDEAFALPGHDTEDARYARTSMVCAAMCSSERAFQELWDRADAVAAGDAEAFVGQLMSCAKSRGQAAASTAAAVRKAVSYGHDIAAGLRALVPDAVPSTLLAEGIRFSARLSAAQGKLSVDDLLAQDELLETLEIPELLADCTPDALVAAIKGDQFLRSNRFMPVLPLAMGRVRPATVEDDLLAEHARAWCTAHAPAGKE